MTQLCLNAFNGSPYLGAPVPLLDQIDAAAAAGFELIGLDRYSIEAHLAEGSSIKEVAGRLQQVGIACGAITAASMLGKDGGAALRRAGEWAAELSAPYVQVNVALPPDAQQAGIELACKVLTGRARLAIEYMPFTPLSRVADAVKLAGGAGFERAGVLIDVWHHERGADAWDNLAAVPPEAIAYVEFDDAMPLARPVTSSEAHHPDLPQETLSRRTFPGEGAFDLARFVTTIRALKYTGMVSVEILNEFWRGRDFGAFAAHAHNTSRPYWPKPL